MFINFIHLIFELFDYSCIFLPLKLTTKTSLFLQAKLKYTS